ncbi:hypothetical protein [Nonomuraea sp. NPDC049750]
MRPGEGDKPYDRLAVQAASVLDDGVVLLRAADFGAAISYHRQQLTGAAP